MAIERFYDDSKNPELASIPGVPLADIDEETWALLPAWIQASVDASPFYRKTKVPTAAAASRRTAETDKES